MPQYEVSDDRLDKLYTLTYDDSQPPLPSNSARTSSKDHDRDRDRDRERKHRSKRKDREGSKDGPGKFRFKKKRPREEEDDLGRGSRSRKRERERDGHSRTASPPPQSLPLRQRHRRSKSKDREYIKPRDDYIDDETFENSARLPSPDTAFRESLFDAMADDEGAAFWEGVYGQPVHVYARPAKGGDPTPKGELEMMDDDEYAEYVRRKMWEKTHEHVLEERRRREEEKERRKEREAADRVEWEKAERERLRKEKARKERKARERMEGMWEAYKDAWTTALSAGGKGKIPWPVESGKIEDVEKKNVEKFFTLAIPGRDLMDALKVERVRWHPDKIQQKLGGLEEEVMRKVTAVFQTVDEMWNEQRR